MPSPVVVWFRNDLRLGDHEALATAAASGRPVIPIYVHDDEPSGGLALGAASRWWLHESLAALDAALRERGSRLILARGEPSRAIAALVRDSGATTVHYHRQHGPGDLDAADRAATALRELGVETIEHRSTLLVEPEALASKAGTPFRVFSAFHRAHRLHAVGAPLPAPDALSAPTRWPPSAPLEALELRLSRDAAGPVAPEATPTDLRASWTPGEHGARRALDGFLGLRIQGYGDDRDHPAREATSRLSPHLRFGEISPRDIVASIESASEAFLRELVWREFAHHLLAHAPSMLDTSLDARFERLEWIASEEEIEAWQAGRTGYPIVDAGMRELLATGWMHNRVRMIAASFLVKDLLAPWQRGAAWFWEKLVDADAANNAMNWQWVAGCGTEASPFFRIFNPVTQAERFDSDGAYVRRWVPELAGLARAVIHRPWDASPLELAAAGVELGRDYPHRIVEHAVARERALEAYRGMKSGGR